MTVSQTSCGVGRQDDRLANLRLIGISRGVVDGLGEHGVEAARAHR